MIVVLDRNPELYELSIKNEELFFQKTEAERKSFENLILSQLCSEFDRLKISPGYHVSAIGQPDASGWDGGLCMHEEDGYWLVYHSERGNRERPTVFTSVQSAANYFLWRHVSKPSGRNSDVGMFPQLID